VGIYKSWENVGKRGKSSADQDGDKRRIKAKRVAQRATRLIWIRFEKEAKPSASQAGAKRRNEAKGGARRAARLIWMRLVTKSTLAPRQS
jgi:hypothetical protein